MVLADFLQQYFVAYGSIILIPLLMIEGPLMAIAGGFLVSTKIISFWSLYLAYLLADLIMSNVYYFAGSSSKKIFVRIRNRFINHSGTNQKRSKAVRYLKNKLIDNYPLAYTTTKFVPIPYSTTTATILSGMLGIKYKRMMKYVFVIAPIQGLIYIGFGYGVADGVFNESTLFRMVFFTGSIIVIALLFNFREKIMNRIMNYNDHDGKELV